ncbi:MULTISPECIES: SDR family oxidoreductase [unclassified Rhodococcus (in: high G+C Gram-positive bacteria)]|uniref:SDR family oxidoreductase n=1 Tax=unclassified Rhodococcus (in: high G+C Gram-positive bacteria) TaxID=192944 RepID=UPI0009DFB25D|nr:MULTISPECIES: SDR family oxidoreductase [unclassified Rhodococcus (in: high G+C Gram-positive bacteria)]MDQ1181273.1 NAD(P)-dependent dehydrogenase (short-subunit alcohol dehydrogenase family) [Rhodococcus sp. SORGH_AS_0301]
MVQSRLRGRRPRRSWTDLRGAIVLVTGAASGIGRATAIEAARRGARLVVTDIAEAGLAATAATIAENGGSVVASRAFDVSDHDAVASFADAVHAEVGSVDVVMNVAGISAWGTVENMAHETWKALIDINLMGPIHVTQCFVPPMIAAGRGGYLVNVSSSAGLLAYPWHAAYSASKFGVRGMSEVLRYDLARHGIDVSLVVPGAVRTPLVETVDIAGVDRDDPRVRKLTARFEAHAVSPEVVAEKILTGMAKRHFLVYSSNDIRVGYWVSRKFARPYEMTMQAANDYFSRLLR